MPRKDKVQLGHAKSMRSEPTGPEAALWHFLRAKRLNGIKFSRQVLIGPYIADFAARSHLLAIELDGDSHAAQEAYDYRRTEVMQQAGWTVIRFANTDVTRNIEGVLDVIVRALDTPPLPGPLPTGEREA